MLNKLNKNLYLMCAAMAMGIASSCTSDAPEIPAEELYTREWVKNFGVMDATQDWNNATRGSVQVDVKGGPKRVRVTTVIDDVTYLLADYPEVSGVQKLEFDIPRGLRDVRVLTDAISVRAQMGGLAVLDESEVLGDIHENGINITKEKYLITDAHEPTHYRDKLPESVNNLGKVPNNFQFTSNGSFIVYPIYWNTSQKLTVGVYTIDADGTIHRYPVVQNKTDDLEYSDEAAGKATKNYSFPLTSDWSWMWTQWGLPYDPATFTEENWAEFSRKLMEVQAGTIKSECGISSGAIIEELVLVSKPGDEGNDGTYAEFEVYHSASWKVLGQWGNYDNESYKENMADKYLAWRSMGYKIDIDEGIKFGMYCERSDGHILYSQAELNEKVWDNEKGEEIFLPHASTYIHHCTNEAGEYKEFRVLAFEDWPNQYDDSEPDLNDFVLYISSDNVEEIPDVEDHDADPIKWLIAAEDLGSVDDFDFNDVVFEVEHAAGRLVATIRPLAAGGTLETYLCRDGKRVNNGEWHSLFGHPHTTMVNTGRATGRATTFTIDVPADFTLTSSSAGSGSIHENYKQNMGGFSIEVVREDGRVSTIEAPGVGTAPQMILIFQKDDKKWRWPVERVNIKSAYPRFESWMNPSTGFSLDTDGDNWFDFPTSVAGSLFNR